MTITITIETLRADFEAARWEVVKDVFEWSDTWMIRQALCFWRKSPEWFIEHSTNTEPKWQAVRRTGRAYILGRIARDYSTGAAMLFKLSDGAIDPRVRA